MPGRRHHVVSRGYQRSWADGRHIELIWKADLRSMRVSTKDAFVRSGFNAVQTEGGIDEQLEHEWARVEGRLLPLTRALIAGRLSATDPDVAVAIKALIAVHWARSYSLRDLVHTAYQQGQEEAIAEWPALPELQAAFFTQHRREPQPGELAVMIERMFIRRRDSNLNFVEHMVSLFNQAVERFAPLNLEVARVVGRSHELLTGDSPVVLSDGIRVGQGSGLGLMESDLIYLPLGPRVAVSLVSD